MQAEKRVHTARISLWRRLERKLFCLHYLQKKMNSKHRKVARFGKQVSHYYRINHMMLFISQVFKQAGLFIIVTITKQHAAQYIIGKICFGQLEIK
ncbi:hypothetical protein BpHYR1_016729 [Brachionus plicatilis]|uniref:Uncharacterized protein n=1 Tax=Brachionus plicatilis TaxID=10195 RepID=A0A3M7QK34_BRAPC|nr:hypothetical protein BpHYR1_016729 [Brachionus plicatilis]